MRLHLRKMNSSRALARNRLDRHFSARFSGRVPVFFIARNLDSKDAITPLTKPCFLGAAAILFGLRCWAGVTNGSVGVSHVDELSRSNEGTVKSALKTKPQFADAKHHLPNKSHLLSLSSLAFIYFPMSPNMSS